MGGLRHDRRLPFIVPDLRDIVLASFRHSGGPVRAGLGVALGLRPLFTDMSATKILRTSP
jgi:hypothetical protein